MASTLSHLAGLQAHRRLIGQLARRDVEGRYRGSSLGVVWSFATPLVMLTVYTFVFGVIFTGARWPQATAGKTETLGEFALVLFCGLLLLNLVSECLGRASHLVVGAPNYVKKVVFPLEVLPLMALTSALFHAAISLLVVVIANILLRGSVEWTLVLAPVVLLPVIALVLGLSWLLASLGVFARDVGHAVGVGLQILMFVTPVFYPLEAIPEPVRSYISWNPLTPAVENLRRVVLWGLQPDWSAWAFSLVVGIVVMIAGLWWFTVTRPAFADVV
jgi:lipopolysaccharide transport system permease protein